MRRENLIKARKSKQLTQKQLANLLNISERYYQSIEYGDYMPSIKLALRLSEILEISLDELFSNQP